MLLPAGSKAFRGRRAELGEGRQPKGRIEPRRVAWMATDATPKFYVPMPKIPAWASLILHPLRVVIDL